jgi:hypothetical protein
VIRPVPTRQVSVRAVAAVIAGLVMTLGLAGCSPRHRGGAATSVTAPASVAPAGVPDPAGGPDPSAVLSVEQAADQAEQLLDAVDADSAQD